MKLFLLFLRLYYENPIDERQAFVHSDACVSRHIRYLRNQMAQQIAGFGDIDRNRNNARDDEWQ